MSNERRDEFSGWAGKLEEPDIFLGPGLRDKEAAWDRLHARMGGRKQGRRVLWYRAAAAAALMLAVLGLTLMTGRHKGAGPGGQTAGAGKIADADRKGQPKAAPATGTGAGSPTATRSPALETRGPAGAGTLVIVTRIREDAAAANPAATPDRLVPPYRPGSGHDEASLARHRGATAPAAIAALGQDSVRQIAAADLALLTTSPPPAGPTPAQPKKQLRIVSINEIASPEEEGPQLAGHRQHSSPFRLGLGHSNQYRPAMAKQTTPRAGLVISLSSEYP